MNTQELIKAAIKPVKFNQNSLNAMTRRKETITESLAIINKRKNAYIALRNEEENRKAAILQAKEDFKQQQAILWQEKQAEIKAHNEEKKAKLDAQKQAADEADKQLALSIMAYDEKLQERNKPSYKPLGQFYKTNGFITITRPIESTIKPVTKKIGKGKSKSVLEYMDYKTETISIPRFVVWGENKLANSPKPKSESRALFNENGESLFPIKQYLQVWEMWIMFDAIKGDMSNVNLLSPYASEKLLNLTVIDKKSGESKLEILAKKEQGKGKGAGTGKAKSEGKGQSLVTVQIFEGASLVKLYNSQTKKYSLEYVTRITPLYRFNDEKELTTKAELKSFYDKGIKRAKESMQDCKLEKWGYTFCFMYTSMKSELVS